MFPPVYFPVNVPSLITICSTGEQTEIALPFVDVNVPPLIDKFFTFANTLTASFTPVNVPSSINICPSLGVLSLLEIVTG